MCEWQNDGVSWAFTTERQSEFQLSCVFGIWPCRVRVRVRVRVRIGARAQVCTCKVGVGEGKAYD